MYVALNERLFLGLNVALLFVTEKLPSCRAAKTRAKPPQTAAALVSPVWSPDHLTAPMRRIRPVSLWPGGRETPGNPFTAFRDKVF